MYRKVILCFFVFLFSVATVTAQEMNSDKESKANEVMAATQEISNDKGAEAKGVTDNAQEANKDKESETKEAMAAAQDTNNNKEAEAKELSGMSIVGNDEAPKSLYIVPWKSSEIGGETTLNTMLNEGDVPVDRDVFMRQFEFYQVSTAK